MNTVATSRRPGQGLGRGSFQTVAEPFLNQSELPFSEVLTAEDIERAFAQRGALFAQEDIYSTPVVVWAFLAQVLRDGKGAACSAAVADIAAYTQQMGLATPSGDTGDYCRARAKLDPEALRQLVTQTAERLQPAEGAWHGLHPKLVDGFTFTMMDTDQNQARFPQPATQQPGVGQPIARACVILSLATAAIEDLAVGPYLGKQTGEAALLRQIIDRCRQGDVIVFDRSFGSYLLLALLAQRGAQVCTRLHQKRDADARKGKRLGEGDYLVTWHRPERPEWMSEELYQQIPKTMTLRQVEYQVTEPGFRTQTITVITTLTDANEYPKEDIAELFGYRWHAELDIRAIKDTLGLDFVPCKSPAMVQRHLWVTLLAYNLIRKVAMAAATVHGKSARQMSFTLTCQQVLASWMLLSTGVCTDTNQLWRNILQRIAAQPVANRPGRIEPRAVKRRPKPYPLMSRPRREMKEQLMSN